MSNMRGEISESIPVDDIQPLPISNDANPEPIVLQSTEILANDFLSPTRLEEIAGRSDLENITMMEMIVNTTETTMGNFGSYLPSLKYLKVSNSVIPSVRDIGTSLSHLSVLWMSCCGLQDVDGIASMLSLTELYLSYNNIEDLSPLAFMDELQVLDVEGNQIRDKEQFDYLSMLSNLGTLSISGNPVCQNINTHALTTLEMNSYQNSVDTMTYREYIWKRLPQLKYIDDEKCEDHDSSHTRSSSDRPSTASLAASSHSQEDIELITNAIKEGLISEEETAAICLGEDVSVLDARPPHAAKKLKAPSSGKKRPGSALSRPSTSTPLGRSLISPTSRPQTSTSAGRAGSAGSNRAESLFQKAANAQRPNSSGSGEVNLEDESSTLTFGDVICGNPIKALRARKVSPLPVLNMLKTTSAQRPSTAAPYSATNYRNQDSFIVNESANKDDVLSDLKKWRIMHEERLKQKTEDVQILRIDHDTSSEEISLNCDIDSEQDDADCNEISHSNVHEDNNGDRFDNVQEDNAGQKFDPQEGTSRENRAYSPPPKNLSPASVCSSRGSSRSPASPLYSSAQFDSATVPVLKGASKPRTPTSPDGVVKHVPAPPRDGVPRPRTTTGVRMRRSLVANSSDTYMPLASPMVHPHGKRPASNKVNN